MASRLFSPLLSGSASFHRPLLTTSLCLSGAIFGGAALLQAHRSRYAYRLDASPSSTSAKDWSFSQYQNEANVPVVKSGGGLNARAVRQLSAGSVFGT